MSTGQISVHGDMGQNTNERHSGLVQKLLSLHYSLNSEGMIMLGLADKQFYTTHCLEEFKVFSSQLNDLLHHYWPRT